MSDDADDADDLGTQWTSRARTTYERAASELIETVNRHVAATQDRRGRQAELGPYFESTDDLRRALASFANAEFDWCGSFPVSVDLGPEDEEDLDHGAEAEPGEILSVQARWDFRVVDAGALVESGRRAYARTWAEDDADDAAIAVPDVVSAARELVHTSRLTQLEHLDDEAALEPLRGAITFVVHAQEGEGSFGDDVDAWVTESFGGPDAEDGGS